jgi:hypothetical protein
MGLTLCLKNEQVTATAAAERRPHRYHSLKVDEVSIVTEPAILSKDEASAGAGFPVIKFTADSPQGAHRELAEKVTLRSGEDIAGWLERLTSEAKLSLSVSLEEGDAYFYYPVKVFSDSIIMTDPYTNPLDNGALFFKMSFNQTEEGDFTFGGPEVLKLTFATSGITSEKVLLTRKEVHMTELTGVELGGQVLKVSAAPGLEFKSESGDPIVMCDENGVAHAGDGYSIHEDGVVRLDKVTEVEDGLTENGNEIETADTGTTTGTVATEIAVETAEMADVAETTTKMSLTIDQVKTMMGQSGESFKLRVLTNGAVEFEPLPNPTTFGGIPTEAAEVEAEKTDVEIRVEQLEAELIRTRQQLAGSSTTDPEVGESATKIFGIGGYPQEAPRVAADGKTDSGIFTRHIDKRLLDRRSRLQADLISG